MIKKFSVCVFAILLAATTASNWALAAAEPVENQVLYYASAGRDIRSMDPAFATSSVELFMVYSMFNGLVRYPPGNEGDMEAIEPDLAEKWDVSGDGKTWTFYLRKGIKFHKGYGELTAEDVKFTFERLKTEGAPWAKDYKNIKDILVVDPYTVRFHLNKIDPFFLSKLTNFHGGFIVSKKAREKLGKQFKSEPVGTGPFQVGEYRPKDRYILLRNEDYWRGKPVLEKIIVPFMPDIASRTMALQKGEIHMAPGKLDEKWVAMARKAGLIVDVDFQMGVASWIHFNMTRKPFDDLRVRKALAYATNRDEFAKFFGLSITKPLYSHVPPGAFGALKKSDIPVELRYEYDLNKARQLLAEAGFPNGFKTKMLVSEKGSYMTPMTVLQEQWRKVGVIIELETIDHPTYHSKIRKDANPLIWYNATRTPIAGVYLTQFFHSASIVGKKTAITNFSHYGEVDADGDGDISDNSIDAYVDKARYEMDREVQKKLYAEAQLRLLRDLPAIPVRNQHYVFARQPYIDLGYEPENCMIYGYHLTEKTRILKH
ncbi:MAG: polyamine ABC transporter substrate-binding protein [Deltaproteobacteria bacterium]|nr:polyamine ABC transporter substrate-binding protein [Deltaproteobacteria bacterium]MBW2150474.1 polyamine ABC transporter substrate-binding protein [Deltaproteobacteria bacterium]